MKQIENKLDNKVFHCVWFNAWEHQNVQDPILALSHAITSELDKKDRNRLRKILALVAVALGSQVLQASTGLKLLELIKLGDAYEEEQYLNQDASLKLKEHLEKLVLNVMSITGKEKVVFFIDDLDRCAAEQSLKLLEALKLYLNIDGCIFFLGVDRDALQNSIKLKYSNMPSDEVHYLDKIIQLPFTVPVIEPTQLEKFISALLPEELSNCQKILEKGLGGNPRQVKRFINNLMFNHKLAATSIKKDYDSNALCTILLIQQRKPDLYRLISKNPDVLFALKEDDDKSKELKTDYLGDDFELEEIIRNINLADAETLVNYIYLTDAYVGQQTSQPNTQQPVDEQVAIDESNSFPFYSEIDLKKVVNIDGESIIEMLLIFRTNKQRTWLATTKSWLICILDDEKTRSKNSIVQWKQQLDRNLVINAHVSQRGNAVIDIGSRKNWLYSKRLHPSAKSLELAVKRMIEKSISESNG